VQVDAYPTYFTQQGWAETFDQTFANNACTATSLLNEISEEYTTQTGQSLTQDQGIATMQAGVNSGHISAANAYINSWEGAANVMWGSTGQAGAWTYNENGEHQIYAIDRDGDQRADHFVNGTGNGQYYDPRNGNTGNVDALILQEGRETRGLNFNN
jgi:hypothetical protein